VATPKKILFVCLGNICRSPAAHAAFDHHAKLLGRSQEFLTESCGLGDWHLGQNADERMRASAKKFGVKVDHIVKHFKPSDLDEYDYIFPMDKENQKGILAKAKTPEQKAKVKLFRTYDPKANGNLEVPDPYYQGEKEFDEVFLMVERTAKHFLSKV
jgi:protein-tyrosine phosphatase